MTLNPAYRLTELVCSSRSVRRSLHSRSQVEALSLSGVSHLFITPHIRSSNYIRLFAEAFAEIRSQHPGDIQIEILPQFKNLIVVRNEADANAEAAKDLDELKMRCTVDWREVMIWSQGSEEKERTIRERSSTKDDVINLQFTRYVDGKVVDDLYS